MTQTIDKVGYLHSLIDIACQNEQSIGPERWDAKLDRMIDMMEDLIHNDGGCVSCK